jgi:hypothetical protein
MADLIELARLSDAARELLVAARKNNNAVFVARFDQPDSDYVDAGQHKFHDQRHVAVAQDLCDKGYFRTESQQYYELTGTGMDAADALQDQDTIEALQAIALRKTVLDDLYRFHLQRGFHRAEDPGTQADRLSLAPDRLRAVWEYWEIKGAVDLVAPPQGQGFPLNARLTAFGIQLCEAADKAALAQAGQGQSMTVTGEQVVIAAGDVHHFQHGTTNILQEGSDLAALRKFILEHITDAGENRAALADVDEIEAGANSSDPGIIAKAKDALARLQARLWPYVQKIANGYTIYKMLTDIPAFIRG